MGRVYILGAGASKFAGFPLASELMPVLRQELEQPHEMNLDIGREFIQFIDEIIPLMPARWFYNNGEPDLEFVLALLDRVRFSGTVDYPPPEDLLADLDHLVTLTNLNAFRRPGINTGCKTLITSALLQRCYLVHGLICSGTSSNLPFDCDTFMEVKHAWANRVQPGDCILTFNWDVLNEMLLWQVGKWHYHEGYGIPMHGGTPQTSAVQILKLHGSINWAPHGNRIYLDDRSGRFFGGAPDVSLPLGATSYYGERLIIPSYLKNPREVPTLDEIWHQAESAIRHATQVIVIGYSLPPADFHAHEMITQSLHQNQNYEAPSIQVVLRSDEQALARWKELGATVNKQIEPLDMTFEHFVTTCDF